MLQDTIAAISTPQGEGGIGIVRLSGPQSRAIALRLFTGKLRHRYLAYGYIVDPHSGEKVDEVLVAYMAAPHTYTREDMVEINCHGGPTPLQRILGLVLAQGARLAHPGEFTLRAFLHGRLDLAQAEAVLDVVQARTEAALRLALGGLEGRLSLQVKGIRRTLMEALAYLTARVDFPEDEIESRDILGPLSQAQRQMEHLISHAGTGMLYRQGVRTTLVGRPNVGKSSLLNALLQRERAITSPIPGTTRDTIEELVNIKGIPFILTDTAGLGATADPLGGVAAQRSRQALAQADLVLIVLDISQPLTAEDRDVCRLAEGKVGVVVANKADLPHKASLDGLTWPLVLTSALYGQGLEELEEMLLTLVLGGKVLTSDELLVSNPRHKEALVQAQQRLGLALAGLEVGQPEDLVAIDLTGALQALGEITGETITEELLDTIFSQFCVGK